MYWMDARGEISRILRRHVDTEKLREATVRTYVNMDGLERTIWLRNGEYRGKNATILRELRELDEEENQRAQEQEYEEYEEEEEDEDDDADMAIKEEPNGDELENTILSTIPFVESNIESELQLSKAGSQPCTSRRIESDRRVARPLSFKVTKQIPPRKGK